jgi:hypothetical protein
MTRSATYTIRLLGHLGPMWSDWFDGMSISNLPNGETELVGELADEAALHGVLVKIRDLGLPLVRLQRIGTNRRHRQHHPEAGQ